jgi:hypothetical protein
MGGKMVGNPRVLMPKLGQVIYDLSPLSRIYMVWCVDQQNIPPFRYKP